MGACECKNVDRQPDECTLSLMCPLAMWLQCSVGGCHTDAVIRGAGHYTTPLLQQTRLLQSRHGTREYLSNVIRAHRYIVSLFMDFRVYFWLLTELSCLYLLMSYEKRLRKFFCSRYFIQNITDILIKVNSLK